MTPVLRLVGKCEARLEDLQKTLDVIRIDVRNVNQLQSKLSTQSPVPDTSHLDRLLPLRTYEELTAFEDQLASDADLKLVLVSYMFHIF